MLIKKFIKVGIVIHNRVRLLVNHVVDTQSLRLLHESFLSIHSFAKYGSDAPDKSRL
ncbi:hypothetical protein D3C76_1390550 [compost metagenome]